MKSGIKEIGEWMESQSYVVIGVSRKKNKFGNLLLREMIAHGKKAFPLHPGLKEVEGNPCYESLDAIPEKPEAALVCVQRTRVVPALETLFAAGIRKIWLQKGSESEEALAFCRDKGMLVIHGRCLMMFLEPVGSVHAFHRSLSKLFGGYPK